jgi:hypothetical protein
MAGVPLPDCHHRSLDNKFEMNGRYEKPIHKFSIQQARIKDLK